VSEKLLSPFKLALISGAILCFCSVLIGAFGAHALSDILIQNQRLATFETGSDYHFLHAIALLVMSLIPVNEKDRRFLLLATLLMLVGVIIFSGSLYLLSLTNIKWLGAITPIGGLMLLFSWSIVIKLSINTRA